MLFFYIYLVNKLIIWTFQCIFRSEVFKFKNEFEIKPFKDPFYSLHFTYKRQQKVPFFWILKLCIKMALLTSSIISSFNLLFFITVWSFISNNQILFFSEIVVDSNLKTPTKQSNIFYANSCCNVIVKNSAWATKHSQTFIRNVIPMFVLATR